MEPSVQSDKTSLLGQLRIERGDDLDAAHASRRRLWRWRTVAATASLIGIAAWVLVDLPSAVPSETTAPRQLVAAPPAPSSSSLLDASGYVVARRRATVSAQVTGKVVEVLLEEGRRVEAGEVIARLDDSNYRAAVQQADAEVALAKARLAAAQTAFDDAQSIYGRHEKQKAAGLISAQAFDTAKASYNDTRTALTIAQRAVDAARASLTMVRRNLDDTVVRAPFSGVVTEKAAQPGEIVSPISAGGGFTRTGIGTIVDMDSLEVEVDVSETFINRVRAKQPVAVKLNAYPDWEIPGEVIATIPTADRAKATVKVRIALLSKDERVLPEMGARVSFLDEPDYQDEALTDGSGASAPADAMQGKRATGAASVIVGDGKDTEHAPLHLEAGTSGGQRVISGLGVKNVVASGDL